MSTALHRLKPLLTVKTFVAPSAIPGALIKQLVRLGRPAQLEVVKMFVAATKRYDDAHRPDDGTTMDVMLDEVLPSFGSTALLALFSRFRQLGYFSHDRFDALFASAFRNLDDKADAPKVVAFFTAYAEEVLEEDDPDEYQVKQLRAVFDGVAKHLPLQTRTQLGVRIKKAAAHPAWCKCEAKRFLTMPIAELATVLARDGRELAFGHPLSNALCNALLARLSKLSFNAIEAFVANVVDVPNTYSLAEAVPYLFLKRRADAPAALVRLAGRGTEARGDDRGGDGRRRWRVRADSGWFTMIDRSLAVPFEATVLGVPVIVERIDGSLRRPRLACVDGKIASTLVPGAHSAVQSATQVQTAVCNQQ